MKGFTLRFGIFPEMPSTGFVAVQCILANNSFRKSAAHRFFQLGVHLVHGARTTSFQNASRKALISEMASCNLWHFGPSPLFVPWFSQFFVEMIHSSFLVADEFSNWSRTSFSAFQIQGGPLKSFQFGCNPNGIGQYKVAVGQCIRAWLNLLALWSLEVGFPRSVTSRMVVMRL